MTKGPCRCEATIDPAILDGYACGSPECWRTAEAKASFDAFVTNLVQERERRAAQDGPKDAGQPATEPSLNARASTGRS